MLTHPGWAPRTSAHNLAPEQHDASDRATATYECSFNSETTGPDRGSWHVGLSREPIDVVLQFVTKVCDP